MRKGACYWRVVPLNGMALVRFQPNEPASWDAQWQRDRRTRSLERRSLWDVLDEVKFSYLRPILPRCVWAALEVGCGSARLLWEASRARVENNRIDFTESALGLAQERFRAEALDSTWVRAD